MFCDGQNINMAILMSMLAAVGRSVAEVQAAMGTLPETENLSWLRLNSRWVCGGVWEWGGGVGP
jgi:hypothetical protein